MGRRSLYCYQIRTPRLVLDFTAYDDARLTLRQMSLRRKDQMLSLWEQARSGPQEPWLLLGIANPPADLPADYFEQHPVSPRFRVTVPTQQALDALGIRPPAADAVRTKDGTGGQRTTDARPR